MTDSLTGHLKVWNMKTTACIRTMECGYAICSTFLPGNRQVSSPICASIPSSKRTMSQIAIGTKEGDIQIFDIASSSLVDTVKAHTATVWSIHVRADGQALVSGSADKDVKFWEFEQKPVDNDNVQSLGPRPR